MAVFFPRFIHPCTQILAHGVYSSCDDVHGRDHEGVALNMEGAELGEAAKGVGESGEVVVADVEVGERDEKAEGEGERTEVVEVLAEVEGLEADEVLEAVREGAEAVETGVEGAQGGQVGGGGWEEGQLVGVY